MPSLPETQARFAAALRGEAVQLLPDLNGDNLESAGRLRIYQNNSAAAFEAALARSYPVLRRRVGEDYFRQLARDYRAGHPSRSADLHWTGRQFPAFLADVHAGDGYAWLAELAALEWACEEALVAREDPPLGLASLATLDWQDIGLARFEFQPSLRCIASACPVLEVWRANQPGGNGGPVDLSGGEQYVLVSCGADGLRLREVEAAVLDFTRRLLGGAGLSEALDASRLPLESLADTLGLLFAARLVTAVLPLARQAS
jgi:hypothetical protein